MRSSSHLLENATRVAVKIAEYDTSVEAGIHEKNKDLLEQAKRQITEIHRVSHQQIANTEAYIIELNKRVQWAERRLLDVHKALSDLQPMHCGACGHHNDAGSTSCALCGATEYLERETK